MTKVKKIPYIRVGVTYYKKIEQPLASGDKFTTLAYWNITTIKQDESTEILSSIPKFDSYCTIPNHLNYQQVIGNSYNKYEPFEHKAIKGKCDKTLKFFEHIFGEQLEIGLDYFKLLLEKPTQILPILCLVSESRNTGKTTFLNYCKAFFGANMTINTNEDFRSQFNSDWSNKLIIGVDEVLLDKREDSERIKSLSTAKTNKTEAKGKDKIESDFFGKFILCSNNEDSFIKIDQEEIRYWVRKVPKLENDNTNLLQELIDEIPAFIYFITKRPYYTICKSRMWFTPEQIETDALKRVKNNNKTSIEKELIEIVKEELGKFELDKICFTNQDLLQTLKESGIRVTRHQITQILKDKWHLEPNVTPSTYFRYYYGMTNDNNLSMQQETKKGRYYTFTTEFLNKQCS